MSEEDRMSRRDEIEALLPFYLSGTLSGADLAQVEEWLANDPAAFAALEQAEQELTATSDANEAIRPPADALSRFSKALEREAGPVRQASAQSWLESTWRRMVGIPVAFAWATAAVAVMILLAQATLDMTRDQGGIEIAGTDEDPAKLPFALVTFKADARLAEIAAFLDANHAAIIAGPLPGGMFRIALPAKTVADYDKLIGLITAQPFTDTVIPGRKPADGGS
jgi:anti-sigma-K factor RskA